MSSIQDYKRLALLIAVMMSVALVIGASAIYTMYQGGIERERVRLQDLVQSQARLLEAIANFDRSHSTYPPGPEAGTILQFIEGHRRFTRRGIGETGEITLSRRDGDDIVFLFRHRHAEIDQPAAVPFASELAEPARAALSGQSGTMIGKDYAGQTVLAAYEPVGGLNLGLVAKMDLAEIRGRFTESVWPLAFIACVTVLGATALFFAITEPMIRQLREREARFRGTFENAAVGVAHVGMDGSWLRVNERLCEIVRYSRDELLTKTFQDITHPDDLENDLDQFDRLKRGEITSYGIDKRYIRKGGDVAWIRLTAALQRDDAGTPLYCISIVEDISAPKRIEQSLHQSESRMRALLDASQDEILLLSTEGVVLAINKAAEHRLARRVAGNAAAGAHLCQLLPHDLAEARMATVRDVAANNRLAHLDVPIRGRWFEFWFYPVSHANEPVSEVAVYAREITDRKRVEQELRRLYQAIQQSPTSVVITDTSGAIAYVNPKFSEVTGYSHDEVIGKNPRVLKSGDTTPEDYEKLWSTILGGQVWNGEFHNRKKNGDLFWERASIAPVKDEAGKIINFVAVKEDITEQRAVEEQLRQSQKMQAIGQLTGGIAHDFNNLLTIILGNLQLLEERLDKDAKQQCLVADAIWAARRGGELTHRLLAFARLQPLRPTVINLTEIVRGLTELLRRTLGATIQIEEDLAPDIENVQVDVGELERSLVNLAINARDAMPNGGTVTLQTRNAILDEEYAERHPDVTAGKYVMLAVSDTGTGMPPAVLRRIFEPFYTTKKVGQGSGLGLSMVYGFVKQSGGHIVVYSEVGRCSTFKLFFPQAAPSGTTMAAPSADETGFSAQGKVALVVEDEERLRKVAVIILREAGFSVVEAENGPAAIHQAETHSIDLLFTDIELPGGMNGMEVAERITERHQRVRVLYTSGYSASLRTGTGALPQGATLLSKPYARQELMRQLRALFPECAS